jgi:hypothetical protein
MDFNSFIFPIPKSSYTSEDFKGDLIWIPHKDHFIYKDKIKYTSDKKLLINELNNFDDGNNITCRERNSGSTNKIITSRAIFSSKTHRHSKSMIQKVPTITFSFHNKFSEGVKEKVVTKYIPCLFIKSDEFIHEHGYNYCNTKNNKILIYFHANYEDIGMTYMMALLLSKQLNLNVLSVEYPSYGIYKSSSECSSDQILKDADVIYNFLTEIMNFPENNIIVMGRCLGSGPATYLASKYKPLCLFLVSPFKSIKAAVKSIFDKLKFGWIMQNFVKER